MEIISTAKDKYIFQICEKLDDPISDPKTYWKIINRFLSNTKTPAMPFLLVSGEIISIFSQKASIFNILFASQCTPLQNSSSLPTKGELLNLLRNYLHECNQRVVLNGQIFS